MDESSGWDYEREAEMIVEGFLENDLVPDESAEDVRRKLQNDAPAAALEEVLSVRYPSDSR